MAGYKDTKNKIISSLTGRTVGTEIQPENHQDYALNMLDYIREVELISSSSLIGNANPGTVPVQPNNSRVSYIAGVAYDQTAVFENFIGENGVPISVTTSEEGGAFVILVWNTQFWSSQVIDTNVLSKSEVANFYYNYNIRKTYASKTTMNNDSNPIGTNGKPIRVGDIVSVVNTGSPNDNGYYSRTNTGWQFQSGFSFEIVQTTGTDINKTMSQKAVTDELALKADQTDLAQLESDVEQFAYVKIKNEVVNGNFENGLISPFYKNDDSSTGTGASTLEINSSTPISGNYDIRFTITTPSTSSARPIFIGLNRVEDEANIGDKIYLHFSAKILSGTPIISSFHDGASTNSIYRGDVINGRNTRIIDVVDTGGNLGLIYFDSRSVWDMQMDNFMRINLTKVFGAGNEPTGEEMNLLLDIAGISYINGEAIIPAQKIMQWQSAEKLYKSSVKQVTGTSTTDVMSQKAVTDELALKADQTELDQLLKITPIFEQGSYSTRPVNVGNRSNSTSRVRTLPLLSDKLKKIKINSNFKATLFFYSSENASKDTYITHTGWMSGEIVIPQEGKYVAIVCAYVDDIDITPDDIESFELFVNGAAYFENKIERVEGKTADLLPILPPYENLLDPLELTDQFISLDGVLSSSVDVKLTPLIPIKHGETLYCFPSKNAGGYCHALYDNYGNIIAGKIFPSSGGGVINSSITNDTGNDCFARFSLTPSGHYQISNVALSPFVKYNKANGYIKDIEELLLPPQYFDHGDLLLSGSFKGVNTYDHSDYIPVKKGSVVRLIGQVSGQSALEAYNVSKEIVDTPIYRGIFQNLILTIKEDGYVRFQSMNSTHSQYDPDVEFQAFISYNAKEITEITEVANDLSLYSQSDFGPTFGIKAFKELNYIDGTPPKFSYVLWNDTVKDEYYLSKNAFSERTKIFAWDKDIANGNDSGMYSAVILPDGSILFVYRTQFFDNEAPPSDNYRQNPILYVQANGYTPQVIEFGTLLKPTGWLQNVGVHYSYRYNRLFIAEYTRPNSPKARCWAVDMPLTDPANWKVVLERDVGAMKHFHTAQADPYNPVLYMSSGDSPSTSYLWYSTDGGDTFIEVDAPSESKYRMLNMVFTPDYVFWATDHWKEGHIFWRAERDENGVIDPATLTEILTFDYEPTDTGSHIATYSNVYLECFNAILFLDRADTDSVTHVPIRLYDINEGRLYEVAKLYSVGVGYGGIGFRNEAVLIYPRDNNVIVGWGKNYRNLNRLLGNTTNINTHINNMVLRVNKTYEGYSLTFDVIY